jgi:formylglycine-generating enzyme required for sulfatase activity
MLNLAAALFVIAMAMTADIPPMEGKLPGDEQSVNGSGLRLVWCPAGSFQSESHSTTASQRTEVSAGFWIGKTEVTQAQWTQLMGTKPWVDQPRVRIGDDVAATYIAWNDAMAFCAKLTEQQRTANRLPKGWEYALPTEAQWEHACRAQTETVFSFGDDENRLGEFAWYSPRRQSTLPGYGPLDQLRVGKLKPNQWGLHDMHGNVWEWCRDGFADNQPTGRDPMTKAVDSARVIRGGSWWNGALECRSGRRDKQSSDHADFSLGLRVALVRNISAVNP